MTGKSEVGCPQIPAVNTHLAPKREAGASAQIACEMAILQHASGKLVMESIVETKPQPFYSS